MNKEFMKMNQTQIITGFNTVALAVMLVWVIRTNLELKSNLEEIRKELGDLKQNSNDNTKRSTLSLSRLSQRLEDQAQRLNSMSRNVNNNTTPSPPLQNPQPLTTSTSNPVYNQTSMATNDIDSAVRALLM